METTTQETSSREEDTKNDKAHDDKALLIMLRFKLRIICVFYTSCTKKWIIFLQNIPHLKTKYENNQFSKLFTKV